MPMYNGKSRYVKVNWYLRIQFVYMGYLLNHLQIVYANTNSLSRTWIFRYTLALAKELLGIIRSKFENIPYPDGQIRMDGELLRREAVAEKDSLIKELRETLEETGREAQMKKQMENAKAMEEVFSRVPTLIYIG